jgi:hypothetical protein
VADRNNYMREVRAAALLRESDGPDFTAEIYKCSFPRRKQYSKDVAANLGILLHLQTNKRTQSRSRSERCNCILHSKSRHSRAYSSRNYNYFWRIVSLQSTVNRRVHPPQNETFTQIRTPADKCSHTIHRVYLTQSHIQEWRWETQRHLLDPYLCEFRKQCDWVTQTVLCRNI